MGRVRFWRCFDAQAAQAEHGRVAGHHIDKIESGVCAVVEGEYLAEARTGQLGKVSCGKSCIRFRSLDEVDAVQLDGLVRDAVRVTAEGGNGYYAG